MKTRLLTSIALCGTAASVSVAQPPNPNDGPGIDITASAFFSGGVSTGGSFELVAVIGQPDAGSMSGGSIGLNGGFLALLDEGTTCYANCDSSTAPPILNALDFGCFLNKFAAGDTYANCDNSTAPPALNALDFGCFLNKFAAGCT